MNKRTFDNEFRNNAVQYVLEHKELSVNQAAKNLGIGSSTLHKWLKAYHESGTNKVSMPGSGNYASEDKKRIAQLERELKNTKDALDILKKAISILGN